MTTAGAYLAPNREHARLLAYRTGDTHALEPPPPSCLDEGTIVREALNLLIRAVSRAVSATGDVHYRRVEVEQWLVRADELADVG